MSAENPGLPKYSECEYSLFISYAHRDNLRENAWVESLKNAIYARMDGTLDPQIPRLKIHFSENNGPSAGVLGFELQDRIEKSFGMLLVVGKQYVESSWCEKELKFFSQKFGTAGKHSRLYIAVMSEPQLINAKRGLQWTNFIGSDQLWVPMFQKGDQSDMPLPNKMNDGSSGPPPEFFGAASRIADKLIVEIQRNFKEPPKVQPGKGTVATPLTPWSALSSHELRVAIGPCTEDLDDKTEVLKGAIEKAGAHVTLLGRELIYKYDPHISTSLNRALDQVEVLVVPIADVPPLRPDIDGGHTTILTQLWGNLKKKKSIIWYRPGDFAPNLETSDAEHDRLADHKKLFSQLAPVCASEQAVANLLFGVDAANAIKIYIENHKIEPAYYRLSRELQSAWDALPLDSNRPQLKCATLDLDALDSASKDAAGVVLLLPQGLKDSAALQAQISAVQEFLPKKGPAYPGCVALLFTPPQNTVPRHDWAYVKFCKSENEPKLVIEAESKPWLAEFLNDVWLEYKKHLVSSQN